MALVSAENVTEQAQGFNALPGFRQIGLMVGLALSVALGVTVAIWSQTPNYSLLHGNLSAKDLSQLTQSLDSMGIQYRLDSGSNGILVPAEQLQQARVQLAGNGVSVGDEIGFEILDRNESLGSNSFLLKARYKRALEGELSQTIARLNMVESARVHLAIPKQSAFARKSSKPGASVVIKPFPGWVINDVQTASIVNIVASSVPGMDASHVTVVDNKGRLLSSKSNQSNMLLSSTQFDYTNKLEESYVRRILDIISPIVGSEGIRAQVVAEVDFTTQEQTRESFVPDNRAVRSEQLFEQTANRLAAMGIPGALTNQPPAGGRTNNEQIENQAATGNNSTRTVRNFEIDRTISHTRQSPAQLQRLSVAVIVDYRTTVTKKGTVNKEALTEDEMQFISSLVKEAVGLNEARGDTLNVVNTAFKLPEDIDAMPEPALWQQPWVMSLAKQLLGALVVLFIAFGILRPMLKNLSTQGSASAAAIAALPSAETVQHLPAGEDRLTLTNQSPTDAQQIKDAASTMVKEDPKRAASVLNSWVATDG